MLVYAGDFPDPWLLSAGSEVLAFATNSAGVNIQCMSSHDLQSWSPIHDALPSLPAWAEPGRTWAPSVASTPGGWVLFFAARHRVTGRQAIGVARAERPVGPYVPVGEEPVVDQAQEGGSIDPVVFAAPDGQAWLLWKSDGNAVGRPAALWSAPLAAGSESLAGPGVALTGVTEPWEQPVVERPALCPWGLFYAAGWWESATACIGWAAAVGPSGPIEKPPGAGPWLASYPGAAGPAGPCPFAAPGGEVLLAHHAWEPGRVGYAAGGARRLHVGRLEIVAGLPRFHP